MQSPRLLRKGADPYSSWESEWSAVRGHAFSSRHLPERLLSARHALARGRARAKGPWPRRVPEGVRGQAPRLSGTRRRARLSRTARRRAGTPAARSRRRHGGEDAAGPSRRLPRRERGAFRGVSAGRSQRETRRSSSSLSSLLRRSTCHGLKNLIYLQLIFFLNYLYP